MTNSLPSFVTQNLTPFNELWTGLTKEEKMSACIIEDTHILSDLADITNNALLVCELHKLYSKNRFIKWHKEPYGDKKSFNIHTYQFFANGNDVVEDNIANLFSSIYMIISAIPKQTSPLEDQSSGNKLSLPKSLIAVQKEKVDSILTVIDEANINLFFDSDTEAKLKEEGLFETYSFFAGYYFQKDFFKHVDSQTLRKFFCKLLAISNVIKKCIFNVFQKKISNGEILYSQIASLNIQRDISNKLSNLALHHKSSNNYLAPSNMKTVSELENPEAKLISSSTQNLTSTNMSTSSRKHSGLSSGDENHIKPNHESIKRAPITLNTEKIAQSETNIPKSSTLNDRSHHENKDKNTLSVTKEDSCPNILSIYDGISMSDLTIPFKKSDIYLIAEEDEIKAQASKVNKEPISTPIYLIGDPHYIHPQPQYFFYPQIHALHGFALNPLGGFIAAPIPTELPRKNSHNSDSNGSKGGSNMSYAANFTPRTNREKSPDSPSHYSNEKEFANGGNHSINEGYDRKENDKVLSNQKEKQKMKLPPRFKRYRDNNEIPN